MSCKRHGRKIHAGQIGTFINEIHSTGASMGVIYSRNGYSKNAIEKAKANGIACCRLFINEPAEVPEEILLHSFVCRPTLHLCLLEMSDSPKIQTWGDVFKLKVGEQLIVDDIEHTFHEKEAESVQESKETGNFPQNWGVQVSYKELSLTIQIVCVWKIYQYESNINFLDGSLSYTNKHFMGNLSTPAFNAVDAHPGDGWTEITPSEIVLPTNRVIFTSYKGTIKDGLLELIAELPPSYC